MHLVPAGAPIFTLDTGLAQEFAELKPRAGEKVIGKEQPASFTSTDLKERKGLLSNEPSSPTGQPFSPDIRLENQTQIILL